CLPSTLGAHNAIGVLGGGQVGFNWQVGRVVLGIEGQYSLADLKGDHQNSFQGADVIPNLATFSFGQSFHLFTRVKDLGTIAGRIGLAADPLDRTLFYVKGGAAFVRNEYSAAITTNSTCSPAAACGTSFASAEISGHQTRWGWMAGVGLEYA